jgi:hypothetical protein
MLKRVMLILLAISPVMASAADSEWINSEIIIRGDYFRAATVAYQDYRSKLLDRLIEVSDGGSHYIVDTSTFKISEKHYGK